MFEYDIIRENVSYKVLDSKCNIILNAKNVSKFFGPEKFVYCDVLGYEIGRFTAYHVLGIGFLHRIKLVKGETIAIKGKLNGLSFNYESNNYRIRYMQNGNDQLYKNNYEIGRVEVKSKGISVWEHKITCSDEKSCFIFSMVDIALNNFDVN